MAEERAKRWARDEWFDSTIALIAWCVCTGSKIRSRDYDTFLPPHRTPEAKAKVKAEARRKLKETLAKRRKPK